MFYLPVGFRSSTNREVTIVHKLHTSQTLYKNIICCLFALVIFFSASITVYAEQSVQTNSDTGYALILDDQADFLNDTQESALKELMSEITNYCNVAIVTTTEHGYYQTEDFAADYYDDVFGPHASGTIFVIDRCLDEIFLYSDGDAHKTITNSRAYSITDNTYVYATSSRNYDYYTCCYKTLEQIQALMEGRRIAEPMKYICSALLAIILALLINYFIVMSFSRSRKPDIKQVLDGTYSSFHLANAHTQFVNHTQTYSPRSSSSGGGGHSGGGGGGGHSGGGGGHSI